MYSPSDQATEPSAPETEGSPSTARIQRSRQPESTVVPNHVASTDRLSSVNDTRNYPAGQRHIHGSSNSTHSSLNRQPPDGGQPPPVPRVAPGRRSPPGGPYPLAPGHLPSTTGSVHAQSRHHRHDTAHQPTAIPPADAPEKGRWKNITPDSSPGSRTGNWSRSARCQATLRDQWLWRRPLSILGWYPSLGTSRTMITAVKMLMRAAMALGKRREWNRRERRLRRKGRTAAIS
ncbi:hypothetical protein VTK26DRAFT_8274 [Humicola hyalothermophila]